MMLCSAAAAVLINKALRYFTEYWPSDMTDPLERVYIQWGYSNFLPAIATSNHITSSGKQSLKFHTDVAMMGKLGYDIQDRSHEREGIEIHPGRHQNVQAPKPYHSGLGICIVWSPHTRRTGPY